MRRSETRKPRPIWTLWGAVLIPAALVVLFELAKFRPALLAAWVAVGMAPLEQMLGRLWGRLPFSVGEVLTALFLGGSLFGLLRAFIRLGRDGAGRFFRRLLALAAAWMWLWAGFCWLWNAAYYAPGFQQRSGLEGGACSVEELAEVTALYARRAAELSAQVPRTEDGAFQKDADGWFRAAETLYENISAEFPCLAADTGRAKPIVCSRLQSLLGFTGVYFPFTGEANVNVDAPACLIPATIAHELSHQRMVASENEANFVGIAACLASGDPIFAYSGALQGLILLSNALYSADPDQWRVIVQQYFTQELSRDWTDNNAYWAALESPVEEKAGQTYDAFLKQNDQELGMRSYGACVDLLVAWERTKNETNR